MSGGIAIYVEGLGKRYRRRRADGHWRRRWEPFWALRNVSFEVPQGEAFGIVGRNGAGKSTMLKILSRITEPTEGRAELHGRPGALLEVGTGFHPELSGRENIFLNGALLGMTRAEVVARFDEIIAFAEIEPFIHTAVKHYSGGMYVRLAFAVAAHLEAEILILDEVLAVGDAAFQNKCLAKMTDVVRGGRTVLFVSHNMALVQKLCRRAILIRNGGLVAEGRTEDVVAIYLDSIERNAVADLSLVRERQGAGQIRLTRIEVLIGADGATGSLATGRPARLIFHLDRVMSGLSCSFTIYDPFGQAVTYFDSAEHGRADKAGHDGAAGLFLCDIDELLLIPGRYRLNVAVSKDGEIQDHIEGAVFIDVEQGVLGGRPVLRRPAYGSVIMHHRWITPS